MNKKNKKPVKIQDKKHEVLSETIILLSEIIDFSNHYEYHEKGRMFVGDDEYCHILVMGYKVSEDDTAVSRSLLLRDSEEPVDENKD